MRKLLYLFLATVIILVPFLCVSQPPEQVMNQSRKDVVEPEIWKEFDKSGQVKFLQVQNTAPASATGRGTKLDGSVGERLVEIKVDPSIQETVVEWTLKNKGKSTIFVVAAGGLRAKFPIRIPGGTSTTLKAKLSKDLYTYIVFDNEKGMGATLDIKAKCGDTEAKTAGDKSMLIIWF